MQKGLGKYMHINLGLGKEGIEFCLVWHKAKNYIHFWTNTLGKGMNSHILPAMG